MHKSKLSKKINNAAKWSLATVICSKLITPLTTIILARILAPDVFGIVTITTIIISFAEMFSEAGIGKYIIQRDFTDKEIENKFRSVGFWSNAFLGLVIWLIIVALSKPLAILFKEPASTMLIIVAAFQIILRALITVQVSIMQRDFQFRKLFFIQIITVAAPMFLSIPLALNGYGPWAIVFGNMAGVFINAVTVWFVSNWRPSWFFDYEVLREMLSFTVWSVTESFTIWLTSWVDAIIIGIFVDTYTLGLYRNSIAIVTAIIGLISSAFSPVIFTSLSRLQGDKYAFVEVLLSFQKKMAFILIPASVGFLFFGDTIAFLILGSKWIGTGEIVALWGSVSCIMCLFTISGEAFRALGQPKLSARSQTIHLILLIPVCIIGGILGFKILLYGRTLVRFQLAFVMVSYLKKLIPISFSKMLDNLKIYIVFTGVMAIVALIIKSILPRTVLFDFVNIIICTITYLALVLLFDKNATTVIKAFFNKKVRYQSHKA